MTDGVLMYDSDVLADIPAGAPIVAGYGDGEPGTATQADWDRFSTSRKLVIVRTFVDAGGALDLESGAAVNAQIGPWVIARQRAGIERPWLYTFRDNWDDVRGAVAKQLGPGTLVGYWIADWTGESHELRADDGTVADAVQWASPTLGSPGHYDISTVWGTLPGDPLPAPGGSPQTSPAPAQSQGGIDVQVSQLQSGSSGPEVKAVQSILNGKAGARLTIDGAFGPRTETAVKAWQQYFRLEVDGVVGAQTWSTLVGG